MKQHAVPQAIMEVEFNLFGAMNVRQFGYVAGSGGVGYFAYLIMPGLLKWPVAIICVLFGLALAFVPIDDRSMDQWVTNFLLSLKRETRKVWKSTVEPPPFLMDTSEALGKEYMTAKPAVIGKRGLEGAGVFSAANEEPSSGSVEVQEVDRELEKMVLEAQLSVVAMSKKADEPKESIGVIQTVDDPSVEERKFIPSASATKSLTDQHRVMNGGIYDIGGGSVVDAIVIIRDNQNRPVQVVGTNSKGLFLAVTPVDAGEYVITVEKNGMMFEPRRVIIIDEVVPFVEIRAI